MIKKIPNSKLLLILDNVIKDCFIPHSYFFRHKMKDVILRKISYHSLGYKGKDVLLIQNTISLAFFEFFTYQTTVLKERITRVDKLNLIKKLKNESKNYNSYDVNRINVVQPELNKHSE